ncbi:unnamed protein product [Rhodiola kirilowii]
MFDNNKKNSLKDDISSLHMKLLLKLTFFSFLILTSPSSAAGRRGGAAIFARHGSYKPVQEQYADMSEQAIHERLLRVNTRDYGRYDPAPTFVKPPFKLIPN